jgi:hypothetical protein
MPVSFSTIKLNDDSNALHDGSYLMQHAKLFAYVNNIQITWKTIQSVFCRTNSPSIDQIRAEGNNTKCAGNKRFNGSVTYGLRKEHVYDYRNVSWEIICIYDLTLSKMRGGT